MPGQMVHIEIPADDTGAGTAFWGGLFGWEFESYSDEFEYHMARFSETTGGAVTSMEPGKVGIRTYFDVDDIDAGVARVRELGGEAGDKAPVPGMGWFSICKDPRTSRSP